MSPTGRKVCLKQTKKTPHFSLGGLLTQMAQMRQLHITKKKSHLTVQTSRLLLRLLKPAIHHVTSILSAGSYIKLTQQSVYRRLYHLLEGGRRDEIVG